MLLALVAGCAYQTDEPVGPRTEPFIALTRDFEGFTEWERFAIPDIGTTSGHDVGDARFVYSWGPIPAWDEPFPVGSVLVKTLEVGAPSEWEVHAMVKRGGGYNESGAIGWEWFDLAVTDDLSPSVRWRGEGTGADGGGYVNVDGMMLACNDCHALVPSIDYVFSRGELDR